MKITLSKRMLVLVLSGLALLVSGCQPSVPPVAKEMPALVRVDGTRDLLDEAVSVSGYAESGLSDLTAYGYGEGKFEDYLKLQANPLTTADYVLSVQNTARFLADGQGVATFCTDILETTGFYVDTAVDYAEYSELQKALKAVYAAAGETYPEDRLKKAVDAVSPKARKPLAQWLSAAAAAYTLAAEQTDGVTEEAFRVLEAYTYTLCADSETQGLETMRSLAAGISESEMMRAGALLVQATERLSNALQAGDTLTSQDETVVIPTPLGNVVLGSTGTDTYTSPKALLLVDPEGEDTYNGRVAASSSLAQCLSVVLDMSGNDIYDAENDPAQGCGILGVGLLFDRQGDDTYTATRLAQGCSLIGMGVLYDAAGHDAYTCCVTGQAAGFYGTAILADAMGNDTYHGYGLVQASAGNRCVAYLADGAGNDCYHIPTETPDGYERLDYGGEHAGKNGALSQGCGWGQRNITEDGIAGGIAGMLDFGGDDTYNGGLWVQGTGYWSGIGFVYNEGGNDLYEAYYYSQASVAHYGAGILMDTEGNDVYHLSRGAGLSFVWDRGVALLLDDSGDDAYSCLGSHGGVANSAYDEKGLENQDLTYAFFLDAQGCDTYQREMIAEAYGFGRGGYFLDADGEDTYQNRDYFSWGNGVFNYQPYFRKGGVFIDDTRTEGTVPYFRFWEEAKAAAGFAVI